MLSKNNIQAIILAAGKASRFNTSKTKLSFPICGKEMILYPIETLKALDIDITLVIGFQSEVIEEILKNNHQNIKTVKQEEALGTGHAVLCSMPEWKSKNILILNGDMPLANQEIIKNLIEKHENNNATITFVISNNTDPSTTYGRIVEKDNKIEIVEFKDFKGDANINSWVNAGIYLIKKEFLEEYISKISLNKHNEIYITDLIKTASDSGHKVETISANFDQIRGVNTLKELWAAEQIKRAEIISMHMENGVRFVAPQVVHVDHDVTIGADSTIGAGVLLRKGTKIGLKCSIDAFCVIDNAVIENNVSIFSHCNISNSTIMDNSQIGPFAHIRNKSNLSEDVKIGNFVEVNNSTIGTNSKAKHIAYLGNANIGENVNIGAGTITCNYNGVSKETTTIKNNVFVGSNCSLIAPVTIEEGAFVAAGSVITKNIASNALAIARAVQINKENYALKLKDNNKFIGAKQSKTIIEEI